MGTLYLVATPIGNLEDMSPRAARTLREARLIAAEDTRQTRKLLTHFDIHTPLVSYFEHNKLSRLQIILKTLQQGDVALVSDAGTPAINDPGVELVRAALAAGHAVSPIPGPSAPIAALVASGLPTDAFLYLGYLPRKTAERRRFLEKAANSPHTLIFFETPHRLCAALEDMLAVLGDRPMALARELTKVHEEIWRGDITAAIQHFDANAPLGEFTLVVAGKEDQAKPRWEIGSVQTAIKLGLKLGEPASALAKRIAQESGWDKREVYQQITSLRRKGS